MNYFELVQYLCKISFLCVFSIKNVFVNDAMKPKTQQTHTIMINQSFI